MKIAPAAQNEGFAAAHMKTYSRLLAVKNPSGATDSEEQLRCSEEWLRHREERALRARRDGELGTRSVRNSEPVTTGEIW